MVGTALFLRAYAALKLPRQSNALHLEEKISFFPAIFNIGHVGCRSRLMPDGNAARVPYCRRPGSVTANTRLEHRSTANPSTLPRLFCRIRDRVFAMGPATRIELLTDHFTARFGQRHAVVCSDADANAGRPAFAKAAARQADRKTTGQNGCKRIKTE